MVVKQYCGCGKPREKEVAYIREVVVGKVVGKRNTS